MFDFNFNEIKICNDEESEKEIFKKIIENKEGEEGFHVLDGGDILRKHFLWVKKMPRVHPYYAVKCNPNPTVIKIIAALGGNFDCASKREIINVMQQGISANRIIYANPLKFPSHIEYAKKVNVEMMTVDTEEELKKIKDIYPEAKIIIRIRCDAKKSGANLGEKFGCEPDTAAVNLIKTTLMLGMKLHGFSFHVGSPCGEVMAICHGIKLCNNLITMAKSMGCKDVKIIDIGGGIPGESTFILDEFSEKINASLKDVDPSIEIISEPGRYYVTSAFKAVTYIHGKKIVTKNGNKTFMYYVSDGVYGSFIEELLHIKQRQPASVINNITSNSNEKYVSTIWGPTCDSYDVILKNKLLPEYNIGDWLVWPEIGSYSTCIASEFNGFLPPKIYPIMRRTDWNVLFTKINNRKLEAETIERN